MGAFFAFYKLKNEQRDLLIYKANSERIMQLDEEEKERRSGAQPQKYSAINKGFGALP